MIYKQRIYFAYRVGILIPIESTLFMIVKLYKLKCMQKHELQKI